MHKDPDSLHDSALADISNYTYVVIRLHLVLLNILVLISGGGLHKCSTYKLKGRSDFA